MRFAPEAFVGAIFPLSVMGSTEKFFDAFEGSLKRSEASKSWLKLRSRVSDVRQQAVSLYVFVLSGW